MVKWVKMCKCKYKMRTFKANGKENIRYGMYTSEHPRWTYLNHLNQEGFFFHERKEGGTNEGSTMRNVFPPQFHVDLKIHNIEEKITFLSYTKSPLPSNLSY